MKFISLVMIITVLGACKTATIQFPTPIENISIGMEFKELFTARPGMVIVNSVVAAPFREFQQMINENGIKEVHFYINKTGVMDLYEIKLWLDSAEQAKIMAKNYFGQPKKDKTEWTAQTSTGKTVFLSLKNTTLTISAKEITNENTTSPTE